MKFNKRASMELGISTVVVLVIAMVIIAGGIAFIRGFFKLGEDKLGGAFDIGDFGVQPTSTEPLVLADGSIAIKGGSTKQVKVGFYNKASSDLKVNIEFGNCVSTVETVGCEPPVPVMKSLEQIVKTGDPAGFETYVTAVCSTSAAAEKPKLATGEYICQLKATGRDIANPDIIINTEESQITISVLS